MASMNAEVDTIVEAHRIYPTPLRSIFAQWVACQKCESTWRRSKAREKNRGQPANKPLCVARTFVVLLSGIRKADGATHSAEKNCLRCSKSWSDFEIVMDDMTKYCYGL